jgi:flagellar biosynthetic protein FlhB
MAERQLPATPRRLQRAREQGQAPRSSELAPALALLATGLALRALGPLAGHAMEGLATRLWSGPAPSLPGVGTLAAEAFAVAAGPLMLVGIAATLLASAGQGGLVLSGAPLMPRLDRLNPMAGVRRMLSARSAVDLGRSALKLGAVALAVYGPARQAVAALPSLVGDLPAVGQTVFAASVSTVIRAGAVLLALAAADLGYQRWEFQRSLRMTREEVREEMRETEGDPQLRALRRRRQRELARRRMMQDVARADVVVTNPTHYAVALLYQAERMNAPTVVGKGRGWLAARIKEVARAHEVAVVENPPLAQALYRSVRVGRTIPPDLYQAVAELLAFVWRLKGRA